MKINTILFFLLLALCFSACKQPYTVKTFEGGNITIDASYIPDSAMNSIIMPYKKDIDEKMDKVIGESNKELLVYKPESELSNFVSDVIQEKAQEFLVDNDADSLSLMTLMNIKGLRAPLPKGAITVRNIFELMPFENEIVILTLSGDSIKSLFDFLGETNGDGIAGASVVYSDTKVSELLIQGEPLQNDRNYFLATSDYLANGGDHYSMIMRPLASWGIGSKVREAIIDCCKEANNKSQKISAEIQGRIIFNK